MEKINKGIKVPKSLDFGPYHFVKDRGNSEWK